MEYSELDAKPEPHEKPGWSIISTLRGASGMIKAAGRHTAAGRGGKDELEALVKLRKELDAVIDSAACHLLANQDHSYAEIGEALGITKQAVALRYPGASARPLGGQTAENR